MSSKKQRNKNKVPNRVPVAKKEPAPSINWFVALLAVLLIGVSIFYIYDTNKGKLKGKTSNGEDVLYSINDTDVTASKFYDMMFKQVGSSALGNAFANEVISQSLETTDEFKEKAETQYQNVLAYYSSEYGSTYKDQLTKEMQAAGYNNYEDVKKYLINYYKQQQLTADYIEKNFDDLKIKNISYILVKFEEDESVVDVTEDGVTETVVEAESEPEEKKPHEITADEQARMDAVDAAFEEGREFASIAEEFSEDPSTAPNGGELGTIDVNTTTLDKDFQTAALALKEGETSDWVYSESFGYFRIHCNADTPESLEKIYRKNQEIAEDEEIDTATMYTTLLSSYDNTLVNKIIWEKGQELGVTFSSKEIEKQVKSFLGIEDEKSEEEMKSEDSSKTENEVEIENEDTKEVTDTDDANEENNESEETPDAEE